MSEAFTFRAQPALDLRKREFDARRRDLATAERDLLAARQLFDETAHALTDAHDKARATLAHAGIEQYIWHRVWIDRVERTKAAHAVTVAQRRDDVASAVAACQAAKQRLDAIEKLKEKARLAWEREMNLREQRDLDELATMRFVANQRGLMSGRTS